MSRITDPPVFVPGTVADTDALADFFYAPPISQTLSIINGELDEANILDATAANLYDYDRGHGKPRLLWWRSGFSRCCDLESTVRLRVFSLG